MSAQKLAWLALAAAALTSCASHEFSNVVSGVESEYGAERQDIPFVRAASFVTSAWGVSDLELAVFDMPRGRIDPSDDRWGQLLANRLGSDWHAFVRVHSRDEGTWTSVYAAVSERSWRLMIFDEGAEELTIVKVKLAPEELKKWINDPAEMGHARGVRRASAMR